MAVPGHTNERADRIFGPSLIANYLFPAGKRLPEILRSVFEFARKFALILLLLTGSRYCLAQDDEPITITPLAPPAIYPDSGNGPKRCSLTLLSKEFKQPSSGGTQVSSCSDEIKLVLNGKSYPVYSFPQTSDKKDAETVYGKTSTGQLELSLPWSYFGTKWPCGLVAVQVDFIGKRLSEPATVIISGIDSKWWPVVCAAISTLVILCIPIVIVWKGTIPYAVAGRSYGPLAALFLDKETDTYSLSKFQFYVWTAAAIFGYLVLTIAQSMVQGKWVFADIPNGLPGILLISATTSVTAQGVTGAKGAKGAGPIYPGLADFLSTGGMVVPERFQFFIWTIVGVFTFLFLVVFSDPANIHDLPQIPPGFLGLMAISSAGYVGGKIGRNAGPIIDDISSTLGSLILTIAGRKLSPDAGFKIDDAEVKSTDVSVTPDQPDDNAQPPRFYKTLRVYFKQPADTWQSGGNHRFKVINPDGQEAEWMYGIPTQPVITAVHVSVSPPGGPTPAVLTLDLTGSQLSKSATFKIDDDVVDKGLATVVDTQNPDDCQNPPVHFKNLKVVITNPKPGWITGAHQVVVTNPDKSVSPGANFTI